MPQTADQILGSFVGLQKKTAQDLFRTANLFEVQAETHEARARVFMAEAAHGSPGRIEYFVHHAGLFEERAKVAREEADRIRAQAKEHGEASDRVRF